MIRITKKLGLIKGFLVGFTIRQHRGWAVTVVFLIAMFADFDYYHKTAISYAILFVILIIFWIIAWLTSNEPGSVIWDNLKARKNN